MRYLVWGLPGRNHGSIEDTSHQAEGQKKEEKVAGPSWEPDQVSQANRSELESMVSNVSITASPFSLATNLSQDEDGLPRDRLPRSLEMYLSQTHVVKPNTAHSPIP